MYLGGTVIYVCDSVMMIYKHVCTCACLVTNIGSLSGYTHHSHAHAYANTLCAMY